jgi:hypothetical protein
VNKTAHTYELIFGFVHCIGRTEYHAGFADTEEAATEWVRLAQQGKGGRIVIPEADPVRWCPVRHCHMKRQKPWFRYQKTNQTAGSDGVLE